VHTITKPLAAIDVGSNTIHLIVARITHDGNDVDYIADELELVRLGADVSASGTIGPERMARALAVIRAQAEVAHAHHADTILGIATEGVRIASNGQELIKRAQAEAGVHIEMISGDQEASLTYWGGTSGLRSIREQRAVLDLGGGSLEIVVGTNSRIHWRTSLPLGSGVMHSRYAVSDPNTPAELDTIEQVVRETLLLDIPPLPVREAIACGGTATTLAALAGRVLQDVHPTAHPGDKLTSNGTRRIRYLTRERMEWLRALIQSQSAADLSRRYDIDPNRALLLGAGVAVLIATMEQLGADSLRIRKRGIREGALLAYTHVGERWLEDATRGEGWSSSTG
jgi:exopolyphosphatase/guanosine-5'-triphosphate,3'-diphosphate pyrophosphatase